MYDLTKILSNAITNEINILRSDLLISLKQTIIPNSKLSKFVDKIGLIQQIDIIKSKYIILSSVLFIFVMKM